MSKVYVVNHLTPTEIKEVRTVYSETLIYMLEYDRGEDLIFFAYLATFFKINIVNGNDVAGVNIKDGKVNIYIGYNFTKFNIKERIGIIIHEVLHVICKHIVRTESRKFLEWNIACDLAINQKIKNLPKGVFKVEEMTPYPFPRGYNAEVYYDLLTKEVMDSLALEDKSLSPALLDNHEYWLESEEISNVVAESEIEYIVRKAYTKSKGNISQDIYNLISIYTNKSGGINWKNLLKKSLRKRITGIVYTLKKRNKRYRNDPNIRGVRKKLSASAIVILDVSGSMGDEEILLGLNEVKNICKVNNTSVKIIQVDTEVKEVTDFNKHSNFINRRGGGGTELYPAIEYIRNKRLPVDNLVVITDGGMEHRWENPLRCPTVFLLTAGQRLSLDVNNFPIKPMVIHVN
jgi:predicted metal-dependent peptidase